MEVYIQKWGNGLGLRIPLQLAKRLRLHSGSSMKIEIKNGRIIIQPPKYELSTMLKEITSENQHHLILED